MLNQSANGKHGNHPQGHYPHPRPASLPGGARQGGLILTLPLACIFPTGRSYSGVTAARVFKNNCKYKPAFLAPQFPPHKKPVSKTAQKTPAPHPWHTITVIHNYEAPWGTQRTKPAQGRATFKPIILRRLHSGSSLTPPPPPSPPNPLIPRHPPVIVSG
jgi:hypothetical protein